MRSHKDALCRSLRVVFHQQIGIAASLLALAVVGSPSAVQSSERALEATNLVYASFDSIEIGITAPSISPKATDLFYRTGLESVSYSDCSREDDPCPPQVVRWRESIKSLNGIEGMNLLSSVNAAVNGMITYRDDLAAYGKVDHWATPTESLTGYGDCEDYALVKYLSLVELGIAHDRMRIVILKDRARNIGHAVLAVTLDGSTYILDNVVARPTRDSALSHYQPIYSYNMQQQWLNVAVRLRSDQVAASDSVPVAVIPPAARN